ncbi:carboxypeptidase M32 [Oceanivirga miroungae]|uniref:Metal-dependent carboxypeptidase n=1 Tax=Oceanivirga miroungae TaxID=1130046 RepID=A0A6I8M760_9FUSO|nr:carboxypeptidase M32 [Oceanivirga miroungae]VWL85246.1 Carboxypeptidase 1 [Oceanivirga miroungae]
MDKMEKLKEYIKVDAAYNHALALLSWDLETEAAKNSVSGISETIEVLSSLQYKNLVNDEFKNLLYSIDENSLSELDKKVVSELKKSVFEKLSKIPEKKYSKYNSLLSESQAVWEEAKNTNNYEIFKPYLKEIIMTTKEFIKYRGYNKNPYNVLLDDFEDELTVKKADEFFEKVKKDLVPFAKKVLDIENKEILKAKEKLNMKFDIQKQKELAYELSRIMGFDFNMGVLKESEHPFTTNMNNKDVRFTTHYYENDVFSSFYSITHEVGHAIYEAQISDEVDNTKVLAGGSTMGIHEAQSRFTENVITKHKAFMKTVVRLLEKYFDLKLTENEAYLLVNEVKKQYIRTEADELTYPIHVLIRYEIEKEIFSDLESVVDVEYIKNLWNDMYEKYLGIRPRNDSEGILQDSHWSAGLFGYFPSYAIGSAYASQMYEALTKVVDVNKALENEDFTEINKFLKEKIHKYGASKGPSFLIKSVSGEDFNPDYYINYLKDKFSKIYGIKE